MSTIRDVARLAGVSTMTVSRVVNNSGYTSHATRTRVEQAVAQLGYVPNAVARHLRSKQTHTIALVVSDITNPFFTTIARGVEDIAGPRGFAVMYCNTDESDDEEARYLRLLVERQVDGVLLVPAANPVASIRLLRAHKVPLVILDRRVPGRRIDTVRCDSEAGAYELTRHLIGLGHRRIGVLTGRRGISTSADRVSGVRRALEEDGLALDESLVRWGRFNFGDLNLADGHQMAVEVLTTADDPPTALFAANNFIAFGAVRAMREMGLRTPEDISIVAFDDLPTEWVSEPFLTVAAQPAYEIGRRAAEMMIDRLTGARTRTGESVLLPFELIVRRSSAAPRAVGQSLVLRQGPMVSAPVAARSGTRRRSSVPHGHREPVG
jgi:LacI family transcriptional regulator, galactose operon repressor